MFITGLIAKALGALIGLFIAWFVIDRIRHYRGRCPQVRCGAIRWLNILDRKDENNPGTIIRTRSIDCTGCGKVIDLHHTTIFKQGRFFKTKILEHIRPSTQ